MDNVSYGQPEEAPPKGASSAMKIVGVVVGVAAFAVAWAVSQRLVSNLTAGGAMPAVQKFAADEWRERELKDISVDAPYDFRPMSLASQLPAEVRAALEYHEFLDSGDHTNPHTSLSRIAYKPHVQVSLDGAVDGAVRMSAANIGQNNPKYNVERKQISGLSGRHVTYHTAVNGKPLHFQAVFAQRGQKLWQVQVIYSDETSAADAKRILDSVKIGR